GFKAISELNILHMAAEDGCIPMLDWILTTYPEFLETVDDNGRNFLHVAAMRGFRDAVQWILDNFPKLTFSRNLYGSDLLSFAVCSHSNELIDWVANTYPTFKNSKYTNGTNILHWCAQVESVNGLKYLIQQDPYLCAKLWLPDDNGLLPEAHAPLS